MRVRPNVRLLAAVALAAFMGAGVSAADFDHDYAAYAELLRRHVRVPRVDYRGLKANRAVLDKIVEQFASPAAVAEAEWTRPQRMAFWINAYSVFTLSVIVDHYPIRSSWLTIHPRNSIRQIDGVWTDITWRAAGRAVTLDEIEHRILRPTFGDARIHFAVNCASISCPPLAAQPYRAEALDAQLDEAARAYLRSGNGLRVEGDTLRVSSIFKWYGEDFIARYSPLAPGERDAAERAILGTVMTYGPPDAVALARSGRARIAFLDYDWTLNDVER